MLKRRSKHLALILTLTLLATFVIGIVPASAASGSLKALQAPDVSDDAVEGLGTVLLSVTAGAVKAGDSVTFSLPSDFEFRENLASNSEIVSSWTYAATEGAQPNMFVIPQSYSGDDNGLYGADITLEVLDDNEVQLTVNKVGANNSNFDGYVYLYMGAVYVDSGFDGDIELTASAPSRSGFPNGSVVVGRAGSGQVKLSVTNAPTFTDDTDNVKIRVEESTKGALDEAKESLKFTLPSGFEWTADPEVKSIWGSWTNGIAKDVTVSADGDKLVVKVDKESQEAACFEIKAGITVTDERKAEAGDVEVKVGGKSDVKGDTNLIVGTYGEYGISIKADGETPEVQAGKLEQEIAKIIVKEDVKASLIAGRTVTLRLPAFAKWGEIKESDNNKGVKLEFVDFIGDDGREIKYKVVGESTGAAELKLDKMEIVLEPGAAGDVEIEVGGTAGLAGEKIVVAKAVNTIEMKTDKVAEVRIGTSTEVGDLLITELVDEAISDDADLILDLPEGVRFNGTPTVEVIEGNLDIDEGAIRMAADGGTDDNQVIIPIDNTSTKLSTIKVSNIKLIADRTVPEGNIVIKAKGAAVAEVNVKSEVEDYYTVNSVNDKMQVAGKDAFKLTDGKIFPKTSTAASAVLAKVVTPGATDIKNASSFVVGSTTYTMNGVEKTMDVAPYIKGDRTYLPLRYVGYALGIDDNNIWWDGANQTVTLKSGSTVVQVKIGSNAMLINGAAVTMDVAPEISNDRTMLPIRFLAEAFGHQVGWDATTQTTTID
ncbi:copper amine oxidase N-terminal domain-containing protein [Syntrophomonas erecta]